MAVEGSKSYKSNLYECGDGLVALKGHTASKKNKWHSETRKLTSLSHNGKSYTQISNVPSSIGQSSSTIHKGIIFPSTKASPMKSSSIGSSKVSASKPPSLSIKHETKNYCEQSEDDMPLSTRLKLLSNHDVQNQKKPISKFENEQRKCSGSNNKQERPSTLPVKRALDNGNLLHYPAKKYIVTKSDQRVSWKSDDGIAISKPIKKMTSPHDKELGAKGAWLGMVEGLIRVKEQELRTKEEKLDARQRLIDEQAKERELQMKKTLEQLQKRLHLTRELEKKEKHCAEGTKELEPLKKQFEGRVTQLESKEKQLEERVKELESRKKQFGGREMELESKEKQLNEGVKDLESKRKQFGGRVMELVSKEKQLNEGVKDLESRRKQFGGRVIDMESKEEELEGQLKELKSKEKQLEVRVNELMSKEKQLEGQVKELESKGKEFEHQVKELQSKKRHCEGQVKEFESKEKHLEGRLKELELKEKQFEERVKALNSKEMQFEYRAKYFKSKENKLEEQVKELQRKVKQFDGQVQELESKERKFEDCVKEHKSKKNSFEAQANELNSKEKQLQEEVKKLKFNEKLFEVQVKKLESREKQFEGQVKEFEYKEKFYEDQIREVKRKERQFEVQVKELELNENKFEGREKELKSKENNFEEQVKELHSKEKRFEEQARQLEYMEKRYEVQVQELESKERKFGGQVKDLYSKRYQILGQLKELELKGKQCQTLIKSFEEEKVPDKQLSFQLLSCVKTNETELLASSDILVNLKTHSDPAKLVLDAIQNPLFRQCTKEDNAVIVDRWQIFLLEQLMRLSPHIKPDVRDEAMKLALDWKATISPTTAENSPVVLGFLLLLTIYGLVFNEDEVLMLLEFVAHYKHAVELFRTLGFGDKVSDFVQNLIKKQKHMEAIKFIYAYKLVEKNQPVDLLKDFVQNAKLIYERCSKETKSFEIKVKAIDEEIAILESVLPCIAENNIQCEELHMEIQDRILELESQANNSICTGIRTCIQKCNNLV